MKSAKGFLVSDEKDRLGEKLRQAGKAREDRCAAERDRELLAKLTERSMEQAGEQERSSESTRLFADILCPIDFGEVSLAALDMAARLAAQHKATLHVLHVARPNKPAWRLSLEEVNPAPKMDALRELVKQRFDGVQQRCLVEIGEPAHKILEVARAVGAGLVVMGTPPRSTASRLLLGSVTERVLESSKCPVLVVLHNDGVSAQPEQA
jgi:nucleotide-binding universal stress UspA family protein